MTNHSPLPRPLAHGYLRLVLMLGEPRETELTRQLDTYADDHGLTLAEVFTERRWLDVLAWDLLVERCHADGIRHIVVPTGTHLSTLLIVRLAMELAVRESAGGQIHIAMTEKSSCPPICRSRRSCR